MVFVRTALRTERLLLRPWRLDDIDDAFAYASDPEWGRYLWNTPFPYTREDATQFVMGAANESWETRALFAIELDSHVVGGVRLYLTDVLGRIAGLGYNLSPQQGGEDTLPRRLQLSSPSRRQPRL